MALNSTPNASDIISQTQPLIKANFDGINGGFNVDHVEFNTTAPYTGSNAGKHNKVSFPVTTAPAGAANEFYFYNANGLVTGNPNLWLQTGAAPADAIPIAGDESRETTVSGWTYLPSGMLLQWKTFAVNNDGIVHPENLPIAFTTDMLSVWGSLSNAPASTTIVYSARASRNGASLQSVNLGIMSNGGPLPALNITVFAIGY